MQHAEPHANQVKRHRSSSIEVGKYEAGLYVRIELDLENRIYVAAVYRNAMDGEAGGFFNDEMVRGAFKVK